MNDKCSLENYADYDGFTSPFRQRAAYRKTRIH